MTEPLFISALHDAKVDRQYCSLVTNHGGKFHFKALSGLLRVVSGPFGVDSVDYFAREEAERLRDFLNEWFPTPQSTEAKENGD